MTYDAQDCDVPMNKKPEVCPSCGWPISRHLTPCPPELPLGREVTTGTPWPRA